jgi:sulfhydrogenase subunit alpha
MSRTIEIKELKRVEGHGKIEITIESDQVKDVKMAIFEGPRFFEAFIETYKYDKVLDITRRICAICTASHSLASIRAIEKAFNVKVTKQTELLRDLLIHGEIVESHTLHLFMLALPDYLEFPDVIRMASKYPKEVEAALMLKKAGNMIHNTLSGREVHGMNERVGGFSMIPASQELLKIRRTMEESRSTAELAVDLFSKVETPKFAESKNVLMALDSGEKFGYIGNNILISTGERYPVEKYEKLINEKTMKHSSAKFSSYKSSTFMVGALPRVLLNSNKLSGRAKELFNEHKDLLTPENSLMNNLAQSIELVHSVDRCIEDIDDLLGIGLCNEGLVEIEPKPDRGVGAVEAPRGILYHDYTFNEKGCIVKANIITPTAQNVANIEKDCRVAAEHLIKEPDEKIKSALELIARAYDPCISCAVHLIRIKP